MSFPRGVFGSLLPSTIIIRSNDRHSVEGRKREKGQFICAYSLFIANDRLPSYRHRGGNSTTTLALTPKEPNCYDGADII